MGTVNFAACSNNRPHFTKNNQDLKRSKPIRKSSIILRSRKTLIILLHPLLFSPASQNFLYGLCGWRFLRWRQLAQLCSRNFLFPRSPSSLAFRLFIVWNLDSFHEIFFRGARIRRTRKKKNTNTNKNTTMIRAPANFFRKCEKFAKDKVIYGKKGLEYWNTAKERWNLRSFDMKTSPHRDAIFFLRVSWIVLPKWARVAYFPRKDSLKLNRSVKTPWHRSSMGVERSK